MASNIILPIYRLFKIKLSSRQFDINKEYQEEFVTLPLRFCYINLFQFIMLKMTIENSGLKRLERLSYLNIQTYFVIHQALAFY